MKHVVSAIIIILIILGVIFVFQKRDVAAPVQTDGTGEPLGTTTTAQ